MEEFSLKPHFPHHLELLSFIGKALDVQRNSKTIYEKSQDIFTSKNIARDLLSELVKELKDNFEPQALFVLEHELKLALDDYLQTVATNSAEGVSEGDLRHSLLIFYTPSVVGDILSRLAQSLNVVPTLFTSTMESSVASVIQHLEEKNGSWCELKGLKPGKDVLDSLSSWRRGDNLPLLSSIKNLKVDVSAKTLLIVARAVDYCRGQLGQLFVDELRAAIFGVQPETQFPIALKELRKRSQAQIRERFDLVETIQNGLKRTVRKRTDFKGVASEALDILEAYLQSFSWGNTAINWTVWHRARWHVFNGNLPAAKDEYQKAVELSLYCSGPNQKSIIEEALAVTSCFEKPDMVLLKRFKVALVTMGYEVESVGGDKTSARASDHIQSWEVHAWQALFKRLFPDSGLFPDREVTISDLAVNTGPILMEKSYKVDLRKPDRERTYGDKASKRKKMPQLIFAIGQEEYEDFDALLEAGADVNVCSKAGDTPISNALALLSAIDLGASQDKRYYNKLVQFEHADTIINSKLEKKKYTPLKLAIDTADFDIVEKVIALKADVNLTVTVDELSPLYYCMGHIAKSLDSDVLKTSLCKPPKFFSDKEADAVRRYTNSLAGSTLDEVRTNLQRMMLSPRGKHLLNDIRTKYVDSFAGLNIDELKNICRSLLKAGANPNEIHSYPVDGYTPLMFAAEIGDLELYKLLLEYGGDSNATYYDKNEGEVTVSRIAEYFKSKDIQSYLTSH